MPETSDNTLELHWDGADTELHQKHVIDADTLVATVSGLQELLYLLAMDIEGQDVRVRARVPQQYHSRCRLTFDAVAAGGFKLTAKVGAKDDVTGKAFVPELREKCFGVMEILTNQGEEAESAKAFARLVPNPALRKRITKACDALIPKAGSGRCFGLRWGSRNAFIITEKSRQRLSVMSHSGIETAAPILSIVTGRLQEMDFERHSFRLYYPPSGTIVTCQYDEDDELTLVENRREFVQVKGIVTLNKSGIPTQIASVESVTDLDLSDMEINRIPLANGGELALETKLVITPTLSDDGQQILEAVDAESGINTFGQTREELLQAVYEDIEAIWFHYVENDGPLTDEAARIGNWWRENARLAGGE